MTEDFKCNVLIMGKTGTGKSTLLNYLCDTDLAKTGSGKPVTGEGIYEYDVLINNQEVRIFDSWGIEAGKVDRWKQLIDNSLKEHGVQKNMEDWFHSVIYCIQAGGGRVEYIDAEIIKKFLAEGYLLTVVLTKADQVDENEESIMKNVILGEIGHYIPTSIKKGGLKVIATCAEKKKTRSGETQPFGKEAVQKAILDGWKGTVIERMPKHIVAKLIEFVDSWAEKEVTKLSNTEVSGAFEHNVMIYNEINDDAEYFQKVEIPAHYKTILSEAVDSCHKADSSIKKTFNINLKGLDINKQEDDENIAWWQWFLIIPTIPIAYVSMKISEWVRSRSSSHIAEETEHIKSHIEKIAEHLKKECARLEPQIVKELQNVF